MQGESGSIQGINTSTKPKSLDDKNINDTI